MASDEDERKGVLTNRRTMLKGVATAGLLGTGATGVASAAGYREITFCATGSGTFSYYVKVDGAVKRGGTYQSDSWDEVGHDYVKGAVSEGRCDSFLVKGSVVDKKFSGPGKVKLGGEVAEKDDEDEKPVEDVGGGRKRLRFKAAGEPVFSYRVSVSGKLKRAPNRDGYDTQIDANTAKGAASKGRYDDWFFTGKITDLKLSGPGQVIVDGKVVRDTTKKARDRKKAKRDLDKVVIVDSPNTNELLEYKFRVTGDLVNLEPDEDTGGARDRVIDLGDRGTRVVGAVSTGDDRFAFSGDLKRQSIPDGVRLRIRHR